MDNLSDAEMMRRCLALAKSSGAQGEYPYAAVIARQGELVCASTNRVAHDRDVTRHAEVAALCEAQRLLGRTSLEDCSIYVNVEPCAFCCYAMRETRIGRVVYGLKSPVMGGSSRWNVLADRGLSSAMPEVFAPPPEIVTGVMERQIEEMFNEWNPLIWQFIQSRKLFVPHAPGELGTRQSDNTGLTNRVMGVLRRLIDRIGRA